MLSPEMRWFCAGLVLLLYGLFCLWCWRPLLRRLRAVAADATVVAYASQTGTALELARETAAVLPGHVALMSLNQVDEAILASAERLLVVASTYGEGEAPDNAAGFARRLAAGDSLSGLRFGVLALGDSSYRQYCAFGRALQAGLQGRGAQPYWDLLEVDARVAEGVETGARQRWFERLSELGARVHHTVADRRASPPRSWCLERRSLLNPGSAGAPLWHLRFALAEGEPLDWQAGDLVDLRPPLSSSCVRERLQSFGADPEAKVLCDGRETRLVVAMATRELSWVPLQSYEQASSPTVWYEQFPALHSRKYSIASVPADGTLDLVVRQQYGEQGEGGLASAWLAAGLEQGGHLVLKIQANPLFRQLESDGPLILIGNGSGIAGLRAHLREREIAGRDGNWLLFGERGPRTDKLFARELACWLEQGTLAHLDRAFSRCTHKACYVQDLLYANADRLRDWVRQDAVIMVCGSREGMAGAVDAALADLLGADTLEGLDATGRYRRDVY